MSTIGIIAAIALLLVGAGAVFFREAWTRPIAGALGWTPATTPRNSWLLTGGVVLPCLAAVLVLALTSGTADRDIALLARALEKSHVVDLDEVASESLGAKRLAALLEDADAGDIEDLAASWSDDLSGDKTVVRATASYRLWVCVWLLRELESDEADAVAELLWRSGEFYNDAILDRVRTPEQLLAVLEDGEPDQRWHAARILGEARVAEAAAALVEALADDAPKVREYAAVGLGRLGDAKHGPQVLELIDDPEVPVRSAAAEALGRLGIEAGVGPLATAYATESDWQVRLAIVRALGRIGTEPAATPLVKALGDSHKKVRSAAVPALIRIGLVAIGAIDDAMRSTASPFVRAGIKEVLAGMRDAREGAKVPGDDGER